jgi:hypothetical protein
VRDFLREQPHYNFAGLSKSETETQETDWLRYREHLCFLLREVQFQLGKPFLDLLPTFNQKTLVLVDKKKIVHIADIVLDMQLFFNVVVEVANSFALERTSS